MSDEFQHLIYESDAQVATITFNREKQRNALSMDMLDELRIAVDRAADDDAVRVVILTGAGKGFCAGADISGDPRGGGGDAASVLIEVYKPILARIAEMEKPVIAAVNGAAAGVGSAFALTCDLVVMAEDAYILEAFSTIGLVPDGGATWLLTQTLGYQRAFQLAIEAERIPAARALELGLANKVVPTDRLMEETRAWAEQLTRRAPIAIALTKKAMRFAQMNSYSDTFDYEAELQNRCMASNDFGVAIKAFFTKTKPEFAGS